MIEILSPISKGLMQLAGVLSIGLLLSICFLDTDIKGAVNNAKIVKKAKTLILVWEFAQMAQYSMTLSRVMY